MDKVGTESQHEVSSDTQAQLAAAAELSDPERVRVLDEIYASLEAELERERPGI